MNSILTMMAVLLLSLSDAAAATDGETLYFEGNKRAKRALIIGAVSGASLTSSLIFSEQLAQSGQEVEWDSVLGGGGALGILISAPMLLRGTTKARLGVEVMGGDVPRSGLICLTTGVAVLPVGTVIYSFFAQFSDVMLQSNALPLAATAGVGIGMGCGVLQHLVTNAEHTRISGPEVSSQAAAAGTTASTMRRARMRLTPMVMNQQPGLMLSGSF